ncbi:MAG: DUF2070 family protein [Candidatus Bilamarchaeaceae archaeon]
MGNIEKAVGLTKYFVSLPGSSFFAALIVAMGFLLGCLLNIPSGFPGIFINGFIQGFMILTLPAFLSVAVIKLMLRSVKLNRIFAAASIGELVYALTYVAGFYTFHFNQAIGLAIVLVGSAFVFILWYVIGRVVFVLRFRSIVFAFVQVLFHFMAISNSGVFGVPYTGVEALARLYAVAFIFMGALYLFFVFINAPMKRNFGFSSVDALTMFVSQWLYNNKDIEDAFESVGEKAKTLIGVVSFRREKDTVDFVVPYVHFGPFGNLGGSEFSHLISSEIENRHGHMSFVFHAPVTHDLNPVSSDQLSSVMDAFDSALSKAQYKEARFSLLEGRAGDAFSEAMLFNDCAFVSVSRAPVVTEDINFGVGLSLINKAERYCDQCIVADQHNAETGEITSFEPGSPISFEYMSAVENAFRSAPAKAEPLKAGFGIVRSSSRKVGDAGIKVAVFRSKPDYVVVLIDSNGVTAGFREKLMGRIRSSSKASLGSEAKVAVFTTDTHQVNAVKGVLNPLGEDDAGVMDEAVSAFESAVRDIRPAKVHFAKRWFDINVLGAKQSIEIVSTVNSIVAVAKVAGPLILLIALLAVFLALTLI